VSTRTKPAIILIHGFPGNARDWASVSDLLAPGHDVLTPDLLGFGPQQAAEGPDDLGLANQAQRVADLLVEMGDRPVVLVGHDVGVPIAVLAAAARPASVHALVLLSGNVLADPPLPVPMRLIRRPVVGGLVERLTFSRLAMRSMARFGRRSGPLPTPNDRRELRTIRAIFAPALRDMGATFAPVEVAANALTMPVAVLFGDRDPFFPIAAARRGAERFPNATFVELPGVGHFPQLEAPELVAAAIARHAGA